MGGGTCHLLHPPVPDKSECLHVLEQISTVSPHCFGFSVFRFLQEIILMQWITWYPPNTSGLWGVWKHLSEFLRQVPSTQKRKSHKLGALPHCILHLSRSLQCKLRMAASFFTWINWGDLLCPPFPAGPPSGREQTFHISSKVLTLHQQRIRPCQTKHTRSLSKTKCLIKNVKWPAQVKWARSGLKALCFCIRLQKRIHKWARLGT
jgi:hypothetical protein